MIKNKTYMNLSNYILQHIDPEDKILKELSRETNLKKLMPRMLSGHLQGKILEFLSKMIKPENILEIGTFTGYSTICLAKGLTENGKIYTIEINDEHEEIINKYLQKANISEKVKLIIGDANDFIDNFDFNFDLVFIDGDKRQYLEYYKKILQKVKIGGYILADNVLWDGKVVEELQKSDEYTKGILEFNNFAANDLRVEKVILPVRDGITIIRKISD
jgi:predicted O-methyltransferase YrrM